MPVRLRRDVVRALDRSLGRGPADVVSVTVLGRVRHPEFGDLQFLAADAVDADDPTRAVLMGLVLHVESRGAVHVESLDPFADPVVSFDPLSNPTDRAACAAVHRGLEALLASPEVASVVDEVGEARVGLGTGRRGDGQAEQTGQHPDGRPGEKARHRGSTA